MKKFLLVLALMVPMLVLSGCGGDDDPEIHNEDVKISLKSGQTYQITNYTSITPAVKNDFVAELDGNIIKAKHEGSWETKCDSNNGTFNLVVKVEPSSTLFLDLKSFIGMPRSEVEKVFGSPRKESNGIVEYSPLAYEENYKVKYRDGLASVVAVNFKVEYYKQVIDHLQSRYELLMSKTTQAIYGDGLTMEDSKTLINLQWNASYIAASYLLKEDLGL